MGLLNRFRAIGLAGLLALTSPSYISQPSLKVVEGVGTRYVLSREEGEKELIDLARYGILEDFFVFADGVWYDVGFSQTGNRAVYFQKDLLGIASNSKADTIFGYHIHPFVHTFHPPSPTDIVTLTSSKQKFNGEFGNKKKIIAKVADGYGIWTYDVHPDSTDAFLKIGKKERLGNVMVFEADILERSLASKMDLDMFKNFLEFNGVLLEYNCVRQPLSLAEILNETIKTGRAIPTDLKYFFIDLSESEVLMSFMGCAN